MRATLSTVLALLVAFAPHGCAVPLVVAPLELRLSAAPWTLAAFDLPAHGDLSLSLLPALNTGGASVASATSVADASGAASASLVLSPGAPPPPGLYTLRASSSAASWTQQANVTVVGAAPFVAIVLDKSLYKPGETAHASFEPHKRPPSCFWRSGLSLRHHA